MLFAQALIAADLSVPLDTLLTTPIERTAKSWAR
jgi:hypothetical protein